MNILKRTGNILFGIYNDGSRKVIDRKHFEFIDDSGQADAEWFDDGIVKTMNSIGGGFIIQLLDEQGNRIKPLKMLNKGDYEWWAKTGYTETVEVSNFYCVTSPEVWEK